MPTLEARSLTNALNDLRFTSLDLSVLHHADEQMCQSKSSPLAHGATLADYTGCRPFALGGGTAARCHVVTVSGCVYWSRSVFPAVGSWKVFAGSKDSAESSDSCGQQRLATSFIHRMDAELMSHTEYHMTSVCFSYCAGCLAYLWIIIPLWNVTFQTHWPQADQCGRAVTHAQTSLVI